ncbi:MAG: 1-acyl-sn-glycerol-3-phosphate acyltransferase [Bacteroidetes bacterium]|nr:1-acyl-sn-glycerol-3-phosphate acyltransferase [Bacteroidota bacterium]
MVWHIIKYWSTFILAAFYKRIQGKNVKNVQVKAPVIIAMNHPNAFMDPVAFSYISYPLRVKYLARGDAFKAGLISFLLERIGIVPIFRIQDGGKEGLKKNDETYRRVNALLKRNAKIIVFAEGLCVQERRLRPLKKGTARMVFGAYEALNNGKLVVIPVGLNYSKPDKFRSTLFYNIGEPIYVKDFIEEYKQNSARANKHFMQILEPKMKALITHINNKENDEVVYQLEELCKANKLEEQHLNPTDLENDFLITQQITDLVNTTAEKNQAALDEFKQKAKNYLSKLKQHHLRDWLIDPKRNKHVNHTHLFLRYILLVLGAPFYIVGVVANYPAYWLANKLTRKIVKNIEFYASFMLAFQMLFFLLMYLLWFFVVYAFSPNIFLPLGVCLVFALCAWFCLFYSPFMLKTFGMRRILKNKTLAAEFLKERTELLNLINKF